MQNICRNCAHYWTIKTENYAIQDGSVEVCVPFGYCRAAASVAYWDNLFECSKEIKPGFFGGDNVVVSESFGCVNFKFKIDG